MFGGRGGGLDPRKMKQMMEQMGIDVDEIDVEEVVIRTEDEELVFSDAQVTRMDARGQQTYQVVGKPESRELDAGADADAGADDASDDAADADDGIPDGDVELVVARTGVSEDEARDTLVETDGDLAAAIARLE